MMILEKHRENSQNRIIKNYAQLLNHGQKRVREDALRIIESGIIGAEPGIGTYNLVRVDNNVLHIGDMHVHLKDIENIYVVGSGKGSYPIAEALENILGSLITEGVVVVKRGEERRLKRIEIHEAGHPIPDEASIEGAKKILKVLEKAGSSDIVFAAVTGGSSALVTLPPENIRLLEIQQVNNLLLKCGAAIDKINTVRKHLCLIKGGRLVSYAQPARVFTFTLDTAPDNMPWPDLSLPDPTTFKDAIDVLMHYGLWEKVSHSIREYLIKGTSNPEMETVKSFDGMESWILSVGDPVSACEKAAEEAKLLGYEPVILSTKIEGEAKDLGIFLAGIAREIIKRKRPFSPPCALISGGETTVTIGDTCGEGGPNQETVLGFAEKFSSMGEVACASVDTDGTDGPTHIAGGIVDGLTQEKALELNINLDEYTKNHNSLEALLKLEDAIITGHTGTNVMNLRVVLIR